MKFREHGNIARAEMQLAPMIDVVFILLIFFIVTWNFARLEAEVDISVPSAETQNASDDVPTEMLVSVNQAGQITVNRRILTHEELFQKLSRVKAIYPEQPIILRSEENVSFAQVMEVLDTCQKAGVYNIAFADVKPRNQPPPQP